MRHTVGGNFLYSYYVFPANQGAQRKNNSGNEDDEIRVKQPPHNPRGNAQSQIKADGLQGDPLPIEAAEYSMPLFSHAEERLQNPI